MVLHIVRHGRTTANASGLLLGRADPALDDVGRAQAATIAAAIAAPARIISSPLARCVETAEAFDQTVEIDERLIELDYGQFDLTPVADVSTETWAAWRSNPDFRPPDGETLGELATRVGQALDDLWSDAIKGDGDTVVVIHVSPVKAALAWALGVSIEVSWHSFVSQASISRIGRGAGDTPSLHLFNSTAHLT